MEPPSPKIQRTNRNAIANKLLRGRDTAAELQILFRKSGADGDLEAANALVETIKLLFTDTLSMLNAGDANTADNPSSFLEFSDGFAVKNSDGKTQVPPVTAGKNRRRGHKRSRRSSDTWTRVSDAPFMDGYSWRKYGQKEILGSKFPRSYFRCTHRHDQGCQAIKQVQQTEDDPSNYLITYMGHHICKDTSKPPQLILDTTYNEPFSVISFVSSAIRRQEFPTPSSDVTQELMPEEIIGDFPQSLSSPSSSSSECLEEFLQFDSAPILVSGSSSLDIKVESNEFDELINYMF